jgi:LmbE family N-acetylglucosaminyl deacetylase
MATLVCFHAHPDDESIATGGTMAKAADDGHRVVLVLGTRGEQGEPVEGVLADGEQLWERRVQETQRSAELLGAARVEFLGYEDSGMMGEPTNDNPACFWQADVDEAAERLATILREEDADVLTIYDDHGGYGHPDHIQVHRVGARAAELAGVEQVFQSTINRTQIRRFIEAAALLENPEVDPKDIPDPEQGFGSEEDILTHCVDVHGYLGRKRASMAAHASQIGPDHFMLSMSDEMFSQAFGNEFFIEHGSTGGGPPFRHDLFAGLE